MEGPQRLGPEQRRPVEEGRTRDPYQQQQKRSQQSPPSRLTAAQPANATDERQREGEREPEGSVRNRTRFPGAIEVFVGSRTRQVVICTHRCLSVAKVF